MAPNPRRRLSWSGPGRSARPRWLFRSCRHTRPDALSGTGQALRLPLHELRAVPVRYVRLQARPRAVSQLAVSGQHACRVQWAADRAPDGVAISLSAARAERAVDQRALSASL